MAEVVPQSFVLPAPPVSWVDVAHMRGAFPVRRIYCIGRNYPAHVREMGGDPEREEPLFFMKPADAIVRSGAKVPYPPLTSDLHHEVELIIAMGASGRDIPAAVAQQYVYGFAVGVDLTRRDLQHKARERGRPWEISKAFDHSAVCGPIHPLAESQDLPRSGKIWLKVNGVVKQSGDIADMIWRPEEIISHLSRGSALEAGDLIYTGTPAGVGALIAGDEIEAGVESAGVVSFKII